MDASKSFTIIEVNFHVVMISERVQVSRIVKLNVFFLLQHKYHKEFHIGKELKERFFFVSTK